MRVGQKVRYQGEEYYIVDGPLLSTHGPLYNLSTIPPSVQGVPESELEVIS